MKIVNFVSQSGEAWLKWRTLGIGASEISILMGTNTYSTPYKLWEKKCGYREEEPTNFAMAHGIANEDIARQWLNEHLGMHFKPVCVEDPNNSEFKASLDGFDFDSKTLVEIKCPISKTDIENARLCQSVPYQWIDQVQWQIMLSNPKRAILAIWDSENAMCIMIEMYGDASRITKMRSAASDFWHLVQIGKPPEMTDKDYLTLEDPELHEHLLEYKDLTERTKTLTDRKKEVKKTIEDFGDDGNFTAFGFKVTRMASRPSYDLEQMRLDGVNVDKYLKKKEEIGYYRITLPRKKS